MSIQESALILPADYPRIKVVGSFEELANTPMIDGVNALCWKRSLAGDFREIVRELGPGVGIESIEDERLLGLSLSDAGKMAREILLEDLRRLRGLDLLPSLDCIHKSPRDESDGPVHTDVFSWHADSATVQADTWLCSYTEAASEGIRNDEVQRHIDVPETRAKLLELFGGAEGEEFEEFLTENFYDLHYAPLPGAKPFSFGFGNLWRVATDWPENPVPPCVHRAPMTAEGTPPRLLLIS